MIRPLYPTDLFSLLVSSRRIIPNQAVARDSLSKRSLLRPQAFLEHWLPLSGRRHSWVFFERGHIRGLVSIRSCSSPRAWQIDYLHADEEHCLALLDQVSAVAIEWGVRKLFLRLPSDSPLIDGARRAGFSCYTMEYIYRYCGAGGQRADEATGPYRLRPKARGDEYMLFALYNVALPPPVRTAEGMTLKEWRETRDRGFWLEQRREFVLEKHGSLVAWLQVSATPRTGCFEIIFHQLDEGTLKWLVNYTLSYLHGKSSAVCVAYASQQPLLRLLENLEFEKVAQSAKLVKELDIRIEEPSLIPVRA